MWVSYYLPGNRSAPPPGPRAGGIPAQGEEEQAIWPFPPWVGTRRRSKQFWSPSPTGGDWEGGASLVHQNSNTSNSTASLSPIWISFLILCAKGGMCEGEFGKGRFFALWVLTGSVCRRWAQAEAAWRRDPFLGGGKVEDAAFKAARCSTERW